MSVELKPELKIITGSMFSGKSEELIRRMRRTEIARMRTQLFKPSLDNRYGYGSVDSHDGNSKEAYVIESPQEIYKLLDPKTVVVGIDECQFLDRSLINVCQDLVGRGIRVIGAGLNLDFKAEPFGVMPELMASADHVDTLHAICISCGLEASRTQRLIKELVEGKWTLRPANYNDPLILVAAGENHAAKVTKEIVEFYEARCRGCHDVPGHPDPFTARIKCDYSLQ